MSGLLESLAGALGGDRGGEFLRGYIADRAGSLGVLMGVVRPSEMLLSHYVAADLVVYYQEQSDYSDDDIDCYAVRWGGALAGELCRLAAVPYCGLDIPYYCSLIARAIRTAA